MNAGRIKDPFCKDSYLGISHLPSSRLSKPPEVGFPGSSEVSEPAGSSAKMKCPVLSWRLQGSLVFGNSHMKTFYGKSLCWNRNLGEEFQESQGVGVQRSRKLKPQAQTLNCGARLRLRTWSPDSAC